ncbi:hypothetical protein [Flavivirga spongiicola]|uniref:Uncharacterized protein n=1 Tax=Flavivirga spongiicola TaxID=421621 RepID=A0ABU7XS54_9FLAO|nr:hypothetical protein [Flavivirga sp. MEBiC05379]MDO5978361.1 hypothetical protein [Flavivirga sp. MEBiC05379]
MFIKIDIKTQKNSPNKFLVNLKDLDAAVKACYLGLGTPYQPIPVDNFVDLDGNLFPGIPAKSKITIKLHSENSNDYLYKLSDPKLVCCKVKNVGRKFNDKNLVAINYWKKVFKCKSKNIFRAPEGTLFISPNREGKCIISTRKKVPNTFVEYSIMFSLIIEHKDGFKRRYYFILDPVVRISSNPPKDS